MTQAMIFNPGDPVMKPMLLMHALVAAASLVALGEVQAASAVDAQGNLHVPDDYRTRFEPLGSWAVAADAGQGSKEMHVVYASPGTIAAFRKSRRFPDGTVLVKEVFATGTRQMTTGTVSYAQTLKGWFVMVKGAASSHTDKLWGDGWGWSWFDAGNRSKTTSTDYTKDCLGCHMPAKATDWVYLQGYPVLTP
jgi:hypothetical protein